MRLRTYADGDLDLAVELETDPRVMAELGGPLSYDEVLALHRQRLAGLDRGDWYFTVEAEPGDPVVGRIGVVGVWQGHWQDTPIRELGAMWLPRFQRRGLAVAAFELLLARVRTERAFDQLHAFPAVGNRHSNAACRKLGFRQLEECDLDYAGRPLRCNHWVREMTD